MIFWRSLRGEFFSCQAVGPLERIDHRPGGDIEDIVFFDCDRQGFGTQAGALTGRAGAVVHELHDPVALVAGVGFFEAALQVGDRAFVDCVESGDLAALAGVAHGDFLAFRTVEDHLHLFFG